MVRLKNSTAISISATLDNYSEEILSRGRALGGEQYMRIRDLAEMTRKQADQIRAAVFLDESEGEEEKGAHL